MAGDANQESTCCLLETLMSGVTLKLGRTTLVDLSCSFLYVVSTCALIEYS